MSLSAQTLLAGWPLAGVLALLVAGERLRAIRRRSALNRALHELRRPLQLLAIAQGSLAGSTSPLGLALAAVARLDREVNGGGAEGQRLVWCRELAAAAVARWRSRAGLAGGSIALRWRAGGAPLIADPALISQALDNLIVNALEHGGPNLVVEAREARGRLRLSVADDGRGGGGARAGSPADVIARLTGRSRHRHGLEVVHSVARMHQGRFALRRSEGGSVAVLDLPLAEPGGAAAA